MWSASRSAAAMSAPLCAVALLCTTGLAQAQERRPLAFYGHLTMGANFIENATNSTNQSPLFERGSEFEIGPSISGALGVRLNNTLRVDAEVSYATNEIKDGHIVTALVPVLINGFVVLAPLRFRDQADINALSLTANAYYDFDLGWRWPLKPFIGAGGGMSRLEIKDAQLIDRNDWVWTLQARAGVTYAMTDRVSATFGYRYTIAGDPEFADQAGNRFKSEYRSHAVELGLQMWF